MTDGRLVGDAEHQRDQIAGADHLRDHVEEQRQDAADRRGDPHRRLLQPERHDIGEGELAEVAQRLGDEEHQRGPANEPAGRINHPVVSAQRDQPRDAKERGRAHVVAGEREAVLQRADAAARGIEIRRRARPSRGPVGDRERERDDHQKEADRGGGRVAERGFHRVSGEGRELSCASGRAAAGLRDRSDRFAQTTYAAVSTHASTRTATPRTNAQRRDLADPRRQEAPLGGDEQDEPVVDDEQREGEHERHPPSPSDELPEIV